MIQGTPFGHDRRGGSKEGRGVRSAKGLTLIEFLVAIVIAAILAGILIPNVLNARKRANDYAAQSYAHQVAAYLVAADTAGENVGRDMLCTDEALLREGAPETLPKAVKDCEIDYDEGRALHTVKVTSVSGTEIEVQTAY